MAAKVSLWLMPPPAIRERFTRLIDTLSRRFGTPRFDPHITLCGTRGLDEKDAVSRATALAARLAPVPIQLTQAGYTVQYFRCLYIQVQPSEALLAAHQTACAQLGRPPEDDFAPHLSLIYGSLSQAQKEEILDEIGRRFDTTFAADAITLCVPAGPPAGWRVLGPFALTGPRPITSG